MKICSHCKAENFESNRLCKNCKTPLVQIFKPKSTQPIPLQPKKKFSIVRVLIILAVVLIPLYVFGLLLSNSITNEKLQKKEAVRNQLQLNVSAETTRIKIMTATVEIQNNSDKFIKDVEIECVLLAPSQTRVGYVTEIVYQTLNPKQSKTIEDVKFGFVDYQAESYRCRVKDFVLLD
jgi:hypothetical protein